MRIKVSAKAAAVGAVGAAAKGGVAVSLAEAAVAVLAALPLSRA